MVICIRILFMAVNETHNATFPLSRWFRRFEAEPPGHAAMIMNPTLITGGRFVILRIMKATRGSKIIWANKPMNMVLGNRNTLTKSCLSNDRPMPNIMMISTAGRKYVDTKDAATDDFVLQND